MRNNRDPYNNKYQQNSPYDQDKGYQRYSPNEQPVQDNANNTYQPQNYSNDTRQSQPNSHSQKQYNSPYNNTSYGNPQHNYSDSSYQDSRPQYQTEYSKTSKIPNPFDYNQKRAQIASTYENYENQNQGQRGTYGNNTFNYNRNRMTPLKPEQQEQNIVDEQTRQEQEAIRQSMKLSLTRKRTDEYLKEGALENVDENELEQQRAILMEIENKSKRNSATRESEKQDSPFKKTGKPVLKEEIMQVEKVEEPDYLADFKEGDRTVLKKMSEVGLSNIGNSCYV